MGPRRAGARQLAVQSITHPASIRSVAGEQRWHRPAVSISRWLAPCRSVHAHSSGRFETKKWSGHTSPLMPATTGTPRSANTRRSSSDTQSILHAAGTAPRSLSAGITWRSTAVFPTAAPPLKSTIFSTGLLLPRRAGAVLLCGSTRYTLSSFFLVSSETVGLT